MSTVDDLDDGFRLIAGKARWVIWYIDMYEKINDFFQKAEEINPNKGLSHNFFWLMYQQNLLLYNILVFVFSVVGYSEVSICSLMQNDLEYVDAIKSDEIKKFICDLNKKYELKGYKILRDKGIAHTSHFEKYIDKHKNKTGQNGSVDLKEIRNDMRNFIEKMDEIIIRVLSKKNNSNYSSYLDSGENTSGNFMNSLECFLTQSLPDKAVD